MIASLAGIKNSALQMEMKLDFLVLTHTVPHGGHSGCHESGYDHAVQQQTLSDKICDVCLAYTMNPSVHRPYTCLKYLFVLVKYVRRPKWQPISTTYHNFKIPPPLAITKQPIKVLIDSDKSRNGVNTYE